MSNFGRQLRWSRATIGVLNRNPICYWYLFPLSLPLALIPLPSSSSYLFPSSRICSQVKFRKDGRGHISFRTFGLEKGPTERATARSPYWISRYPLPQHSWCCHGVCSIPLFSTHLPKLIFTRINRYEYFAKFNPDFLVEVAKEYLQHCGTDPTSAGNYFFLLWILF